MTAHRLLLALWFAPAVALAAAPAPVELAPSSKWNMVYDPGSCVLRREFGTGAGAIGLTMLRTAPGDNFRLRAYGQPFRSTEVRGKVAVTFAGGTANDPNIPKFGSAGDLPFAELGGFRLAGGRGGPGEVPPDVTPEQEAAVTSVTIRPDQGRSYRLLTGAMRAPMAAMRACTDDLVRSWGYDPAVMANLQRRPEPMGNPGYWATSLDYPKASLARGESALVDFKLDVGEDGRVAGCQPLRVTGTSLFATKTCQLVQSRARFKPALDAAGKPVRAYYINRVMWMTPTD